MPVPFTAFGRRNVSNVPAQSLSLMNDPFVAEQAGGKSTTGTERIMEIVPTEIHQRAPMFIGSSKMVDRVKTFFEEHQKSK